MEKKEKQKQNNMKINENEILFDLSVCEIEKWDKKEYIRELQTLLNEFKFD